MKPIVRYSGPATRYGEQALLVPINHPNQNLNGREVCTSRVLFWSESNEIETKNTIYKPEIKAPPQEEAQLEKEHEQT